MIHSVNLDQYTEIKEDIDVGFAVFLLNDEMKDLNNENNWLSSSPTEFYLVRMSEEEFKMMDIGVHPKTFIIKNGKEIKELNGFPSEEAIGEIYEYVKS